MSGTRKKFESTEEYRRRLRAEYAANRLKVRSRQQAYRKAKKDIKSEMDTQ